MRNFWTQNETHPFRKVESVGHCSRVWIIFTQWGSGMRPLSRIVALSKIGSVSGDLNRILGGVIVWRWPGEKANVKENDCQVSYLWKSWMFKDEYTLTQMISIRAQTVYFAPPLQSITWSLSSNLLGTWCSGSKCSLELVAVFSCFTYVAIVGVINWSWKSKWNKKIVN